MRILILGYGRSGRAAHNLLRQKYGTSAEIFVFDQQYDNLEGNTANFGGIDFCVRLDDGFLQSMDLCVVSPGFSVHGRLVERAKRLTKVIGELELGFVNCVAKLIAITGTNGKSTTAKLISEIFNRAKKRCPCVGNYGNAFCNEALALDAEDYAAVETSSFQLETIENFRPKVALVLNIGADHLDRHFTRELYAATKMKIAQNQTKEDFLILNADTIPIEFLALNKGAADVFYCSLEGKTRGAYLLDGDLYFESERIISASELKLKGRHNIFNALFAICAAKLCGIDTDTIKESLREFGAIRHRIEFAGEFRGQLFYNDSKATNIESCLTGVAAFENNALALILGGSDKGEDYTELFLKMPKNAEFVAVMGAVADKLIKASKQAEFTGKIVKCGDLNEALNQCVESGLPIVLLSPAAASFDAFVNYEHRGDTFCDLVKKL